MIDFLLLFVFIGATGKRVNVGNTVGRVASFMVNANHCAM